MANLLYICTLKARLWFHKKNCHKGLNEQIIGFKDQNFHFGLPIIVFKFIIWPRNTILLILRTGIRFEYKINKQLETAGIII